MNGSLVILDIIKKVNANKKIIAKIDHEITEYLDMLDART